MSDYLKIINEIDSPALLFFSIFLFWLGRISEKLIVAWYERRGFKANGVDETPFLLEKLIIKTVLELGADMGFIITHNLKNNYYSVLAEYRPPLSVLPSIQADYQKVPFDKKSAWAMELLGTQGRVIRHQLKDIENIEHRSHMEAAGVSSWYAWALKYNGQMIGSLNLYFIREFGLSKNQTMSLTGRLALLGSLLHKLQKTI